MLDRGVKSWRSAKQALIASPTMAIEFIAFYETSNHGIRRQNLVTGLHVVKGIKRPLKLYCDNNSALLYSNNNISSSKSKHINIKFLVVKEIVQNGQLSIKHIGTNSMIVDSLTKGLLPKVFRQHTASMGVILYEDI